MKGSVKFFNRKKGFGFISGEDGKDYFVHFTALPKGTYLNQNDEVTFDSAEGERGPKAENVQVTNAAPVQESHGRFNRAPQQDDGQESEEANVQEEA